MDQILGGETVTSLTQPGNVLLPLTNNEGTVCDLAQYNAGTGTTTVVDHRIYDSFGNLVSQTNAAVDFLFGFTGLPTDPATGDVVALNRIYDPATGTWMSKDPTGVEAGDANAYRYCGNEPANGTDPSGLAPKNLLKVLVKVSKGTWEFVIKSGKNIGKTIKIRNAKFIGCAVSLADLAALTDVSAATLEAVQEKFGSVAVAFDKFGQPNFAKYAAATVTGLTKEQLAQGNYASLAWEALGKSLGNRDPQKYQDLLKNSSQYVWHHAADGSLQLLDKDLHTAYQHTGLSSVLKKEAAAAGIALIPGGEQFSDGDISGGIRETLITFTPFAWAEAGASGLSGVVDECERELAEMPPLGIGNPPTPAQQDALKRRMLKTGVEP